MYIVLALASKVCLAYTNNAEFHLVGGVNLLPQIL